MTEKIKKENPLTSFLSRYWLLCFTILVALAFGIAENSFFKPRNLLNVLSSACTAAISGMGMTCIMSSGEMDFAAGTEVSLGCVLMTWILKNTPINNYYITFLVTILIMIGVGLINAFLHIKIGMPAFIATMGVSFLLAGVNKGLTGGRSLIGIGSAMAPEFNFIGQGYVFGFIPMPLIVMLIVGAVILIFTERTRSGKYLYAVGSNPSACKYIGINAEMQKVKGFVLCAVLCGLSGILQGSMVNGATATMGDNSVITSVTVMMLGATFIKMGVFNVPGTIVGAILMATITNGLTMVGAGSHIKSFVEGGVLFGAVTIVVLLRARVAKKG